LNRLNEEEAMREVNRALFGILVVISVATVLVVSANAQQACSNKSAKGTYGYSCTGALGGVPFAAYGVVVADGKGQWNGHGKVSVNGYIVPWTHNTTPSEPSKVNPDCTGSVTYKVTLDGVAQDDAHFEFVIVDNGLEVKGFPVDPGYAVSCQLILEKHGFLELDSWGKH
jgi:hypothetical protein